MFLKMVDESWNILSPTIIKNIPCPILKILKISLIESNTASDKLNQIVKKRLGDLVVRASAS